MIILWIARDLDGKLYLYKDRPIKCKTHWMVDDVNPELPQFAMTELPQNWYKKITFEDKCPKRVTLQQLIEYNTKSEDKYK